MNAGELCEIVDMLPLLKNQKEKGEGRGGGEQSPNVSHFMATLASRLNKNSSFGPRGPRSIEISS